MASLGLDRRAFRALIVCLALPCLWAPPGWSQPELCRADITEADGFAIRAMRVDGWWTPQLALPSGGYSPDKVSQAIELTRTALDADRNRDAEFASVGAVSVLYIDSCVRVVDEAKCQDALGSPKCVDVAIRPHSLRLDLLRVGSNVLPIPRVNRPTFFDEVPAPLLLLHPVLATAYDRQFGLSQSAAVATNLLDLSKIARGEPLTPNEMQMQLRAGGRKSLTEPFYNANADLSISQRRLGRTVEELAFSGHYASDDEPLGGGRHVAYGVGTDASVGFRPRLPILQRLTVGGGYRWSRDKLFADTASEAGSEHAGEGRVVAEALVAGGFARLGLWGDAAAPTGDLEAYQRVAGMFGYAKEFAIGLNQTIGVEMVAAGGHAWGNPPEYARFFGGNSTKSFLYDAVDAPTLTAVPRGPLIRSLGEARAGVRTESGDTGGGTSFWGVSLNVSVPIPPWSRPLIPNEVIESLADPDGTERDVTLKDVLKKQVAQGERLLRSSLVRQGVAPDDAARQARDTWKEIQPAADFIADQANLYSVKPLLMLDVARLSDTASGDGRVRVAIGGGLQLTIVVARFEAGYLHTVQRAPGDDRGNFFVRLTFQNLF